MGYPLNNFTSAKCMCKSEQDCFVDEKLLVYVYITYKSAQFVMKQLPAGAISYSIDKALA